MNKLLLMDKLTSVKIATTTVNKAKQIKKKTGVSIGKQFELAFAFYNQSLKTPNQWNK